MGWKWRMPSATLLPTACTNLPSASAMMESATTLLSKPPRYTSFMIDTKSGSRPKQYTASGCFPKTRVRSDRRARLRVLDHQLELASAEDAAGGARTAEKQITMPMSTRKEIIDVSFLYVGLTEQSLRAEDENHGDGEH